MSSRDISKLQVICSLFAERIGDDLYFARQILESIEAALPSDKQDSDEAFLLLAEHLSRQIALDPAEYGIGLVPTKEEHGFSMLSLRDRLLKALKKTCQSEHQLVVLTGLKEAICPKGKRWSPRRKAEYKEAIDFARAFCQSRSRPSSKLSLVIF